MGHFLFVFLFWMLAKLKKKKTQGMKRKEDPNLDSPIFNTNGGICPP